MSRIYERLSAVRFLSRSYTFKFLFIAFLGIHIPLIGLIFFVLFRPESLSAASVVTLTLILTLAATGITLFILNGLLSPLRRSRLALEQYRQGRVRPQLPTEYADEAGQLMQHIQFTITELDELLEEKQDLTSLLSHDLRIPIQNVRTFSRLLLKHTDDPVAVTEVAEMITASADEQNDLLEQVLEILRQDHLFFSERRHEKVPVRSLIDETIDIFSATAAEKGIRLEKELSYDGTVEVQPELFRQVLKNLTSNAIKFTHQGGAVRFVSYRKNGRTLLEVQDDGIGFEQQVAERLFDRFTKKGRKGTAGEPTTGIGLYLSRKVIRHHQGDLTAFSEGEGKGSVFSVSLS